MRRTPAPLRPTTAAVARVLQGVAASGFSRVVLWTTCLISAALMRRGRLGRGASLANPRQAPLLEALAPARRLLGRNPEFGLLRSTLAD